MSASEPTPLHRRERWAQTPSHPLSLFGLARSADARSFAGPMLDLRVSAGTELVTQGALTGTFYVIRSGTAELVCDGSRVAVLGAGDCFGEIDPVEATPQPYGIVAGPGLRLFAFSAVSISRLCEQVPHARDRILAALPDSHADVYELPGARNGLGPAAAGTRS